MVDAVTKVSWVPEFWTTASATFIGVVGGTLLTMLVAYLVRRPRLGPTEKRMLLALILREGDGQILVQRDRTLGKKVVILGSGIGDPFAVQIESVRNLIHWRLIESVPTPFEDSERYRLSPAGHRAAARLRRKGVGGHPGYTSSP